MAEPNVWAPVWAKFAQLGVAVAPEVAQKLETFIKPIADKDANTIVTAIADHVEMHGIAGMMDGTLKNALIGSEPTIDNVINTNIDGGADALVELFKSIAASASTS